MRQHPIPLLADLPIHVIIIRCAFCRELVSGTEACSSTREAMTCPPRAFVDMSGACKSSTASPTASPILSPTAVSLSLTAAVGLVGMFRNGAMKVSLDPDNTEFLKQVGDMPGA